MKSIIKVLLETVAEGDQKAPFSIATTPRYRGGAKVCSTLTLDPYLILLSDKQGLFNYHYLSL